MDDVMGQKTWNNIPKILFSDYSSTKISDQVDSQGEGCKHIESSYGMHKPKRIR